MTIELRWLDRPGKVWTGRYDTSLGKIVDQKQEPFGTERVLQYRERALRIIGDIAKDAWSDWQDVPVVSVVPTAATG